LLEGKCNTSKNDKSLK